MKNTKQPVDYIIPVNILSDGQVEIKQGNERVYGEVDRTKDVIDVFMTAKNWNEYQKLKGIDKDDRLRILALEQYQQNLRNNGL